MSNPTSVLVTGSNAGLGLETVRQLAAKPEVTRLVLGVRNAQKGRDAIEQLEADTGRSIFELAVMDLESVDSVRSAVESLAEPVDALVMNAGGLGNKSYAELTDDGVTRGFAQNVLGHAALTNGLLEAGKLTGTAVFVSTEAARGIPVMGMKRPTLKTSSVEEFASIADGSWFNSPDPNTTYGPIKFVGTMWSAAMARRHPSVRFVAVSPGATRGTNGPDQLGAIQRFMFRRVAYPMLSLLGRAHSLEDGASRYVDVLFDQAYTSGKFYAAKYPTTSGALTDQAPTFTELENTAAQDNAAAAIDNILSQRPAAAVSD